MMDPRAHSLKSDAAREVYSTLLKLSYRGYGNRFSIDELKDAMRPLNRENKNLKSVLREIEAAELIVINGQEIQLIE